MSLKTPADEVCVDVASNLESVKQRIEAACKASGRSFDDIQLVAVSKTKPLSLLREAYDQNQRVFGENYVQELVSKAHDMPSDVRWHYIGTLQSNKVNNLVKNVVPQAESLTVETVSSSKLAKKLDSAMEFFDDKILDVFVQVNTSGEDSKGGVQPDEVGDLCRVIVKDCKRLNLKGLMTIGAAGDVSCFDVLVNCRDDVAEMLEKRDLSLSMGMSGDFEKAIQRGATNVRVGSTIFGSREYTKSG